MRVLLVTYYFPPAGGGGVQRVLGWCRHLPAHGIEVTALAPHEPHWVDQDTTLVVPGATRVVRTADPSPAAVIPRAELAQVGGARRVVRRIALQPRRFSVPDVHRRWRRPAVRAALAEAARMGAEGEPAWDAVISSSPPETTHLVAHDIAEALGIPWIADFRDSWLDLPHLRMASPAVRLKHAANRRLATRILRRATAATTVSEPLAADLRRRHPHLAVTVVENGVEGAEVDRAGTRAEGFRDVGRFVVAYTGNFFGLQSARSFLDAVERAIGDEPRLADDLLVRFVGGLKPGERDQAFDAARIPVGVVEHAAFLRHDDVLAQQRAADLLLLYVASGAGSAGVYTGKVFEYVAARRPVLALVPAGNVAGRLLERAGSTEANGGARVEPDDVAAIGDALVSAWRAWIEAGGRDGARTADIAVPTSVRASIERSAGAGVVAQLVRDAVRRP